MNNRILIRTDGSSQIGLGHLVRCIALSQMLSDQFEIHFVCREIPDNIIPSITASGWEVNLIDEEDNFFSMLSLNDLVVIDHYGLDTSYYLQVKECGCKIICVDDIHDKYYYSDLIINPTPSVTSNFYCTPPYTQFALGPDYALLRPAFLF